MSTDKYTHPHIERLVGAWHLLLSGFPHEP